jgi:hypothetical protein
LTLDAGRYNQPYIVRAIPSIFAYKESALLVHAKECTAARFYLGLRHILEHETEQQRLTREKELEAKRAHWQGDSGVAKWDEVEKRLGKEQKMKLLE